MAEPTIPESMLAIAIRDPGPDGRLEATQRPVPAPGDDEVLIRVAAAGVNRPDCLQRQGLYPPPPGASDLPGLEVAGTVVACGRNVRSPAVNDEVCALLNGGGYAGYCAVPAVQCLPVPAGVSLVEAAALPETVFTVWNNVFDRGKLRAGETLLVHGGASGIGTMAIQLGRAFGATVIATAGSDEKLALCRRLGASLAINYRESDFRSVISEQHPDGAKAGVDVILDIVGATHLDANLRVLNDGGRLVIIAVLGGARAEINLARVMTRRLTVTGSTLRARPAAEKGRLAAAIREQVWPLIESGAVRPVIQQTLPLREAHRAHATLDANEAMGKTVLLVGNG